ncbi:MAG: hypothetical protein ACK4WH_02515 [Phycisphaerales bacterium]
MIGSVSLPGDQRFAAACRIAGALAEDGFARLTIRQDGVERPLEARNTDLPGLLSRGDLELSAPGLTLRFTGPRVEWSAERPELAEAIRACLA